MFILLWFSTFPFLLSRGWPYLCKRKDDNPLSLIIYHVFPQYLPSTLLLVQLNLCNYCWLHPLLFSTSGFFSLILRFKFYILISLSYLTLSSSRADVIPAIPEKKDLELSWVVCFSLHHRDLHNMYIRNSHSSLIRKRKFCE